MTDTAPAPRSEYERLVRFMVAPGRPFGLLAACVNDSRREAELRALATEDAKKAGVAVAEADVGSLNPGDDVIGALGSALRDAAPAQVLFVRGSDDLAPSSGDRRPAQVLNFARDRLPDLLPARIVLWMSVEGRTRLAQAAPDLSNVILSTLIFPSAIDAEPRPMLHQLGEGPGWYASPIQAGDALAERDLLLRLLDDPERSIDSQLDAGLRIAEIDAARGELREAIQRAEQMVALSQANNRPRQSIDGLSLLAGIAHRTGRTLEALQHQSAAHRLIEALLAASPKSVAYERSLAWSFVELGDLYAALGQGEKARDAFQNSLDIRHRLALAEPDRADYQRDLSVCYDRMGVVSRDLGLGEKARDAFQNSLNALQRLALAEPERADYQRDLSVSYSKMGEIFRNLGIGEKARDAFQNSLDIAERLALTEPERADYQRDLASSFKCMATVTEGTVAARFIGDAIAIHRRLLEAAPGEAVLARDLGIALLQQHHLTQDQSSLLEAADLLVSLRRRDALEARYHDLADQLAPLLESAESAPGAVLPAASQ